MKYISFILNFPYTLIGLISIIFFQPIDFKFDRKHLAFIFNVKNFNISFGKTMKKSRARTVGNVVALGPNKLKKDLEHELIHVDQANKTPLIWPVLYYWEYLRHGYRNNKYEDEAFRLSNSIHRP